MWVFDEEYEGKMLSQIINETHENPKVNSMLWLPLTPTRCAVSQRRDAARQYRCHSRSAGGLQRRLISPACTLGLSPWQVRMFWCLLCRTSSSVVC